MKTWREIVNTDVANLNVGDKFISDDGLIAEITSIDPSIPLVEWVSGPGWDESGNLFLHCDARDNETDEGDDDDTTQQSIDRRLGCRI